MLPLKYLHSLADVLPPHIVTAHVLILSAFITIIVAIWRRRFSILQSFPHVLFVLFCSVLFLPESLPGVPSGRGHHWLIGLAAIMCIIAVIIARKQQFELSPGETRTILNSSEGEGGSERTALIYMGLVMLIAAFSMFFNLGSYSGPLLTWETTTVQSYGEAYLGGEKVIPFVLKRFIWDLGLSSRGQASLLFGAPTYVLFHIFGFSTWTLRFVAVILALLCIPAMYLVGRRFFGPFMAGTLSVLLGLNTNTLYFGRYGSCMSAMILGLIIAMYCTWLFLKIEKPKWWMGLMTAIALYLATVSYASARLVVVIMIGLILTVCALEWRKLRWQRSISLIILLLCLYGGWRFQKAYGGDRVLFDGRGEQFLNFIRDSGYIRDYLKRNVDPNQMTRFDKFELLYRVLEITIPEYINCVTPGIGYDPNRRGAHAMGYPAPIRLYYGPLIPFVLLGLGFSIVRYKNWLHAFLLVWVILCSGPLLLCNRVDSHRILPFIIPFVIWTALGIWQSAKVMRLAGVPQVIQHIFAGALILTVIYVNSNVLYGDSPRPTGFDALSKEINLVKGPVVVAAEMDHESVGYLNLALLERTRVNPEWRSSCMDEQTLNAIKEGVLAGGRVPELHLYKLQELLKTSTLFFAPVSQFRTVTQELQDAGARLYNRGTPEFTFYRLNNSQTINEISNEALSQLPSLPTPTAIPTPVQFVLQKGAMAYLSDLETTSVEASFAPPRLNAEIGGGPIQMGGTSYFKGIGAHAPCRMTYSVPIHAQAFQAVIGLTDGMRECGPAAVTFEIWDNNNQRLYESGLIDSNTPPKLVSLMLQGAATITLVVTDGGNGTDCDHANWAEAAFLLNPPAPTPAGAEPVNETSASGEISSVTAADANVSDTTSP